MFTGVTSALDELVGANILILTNNNYNMPPIIVSDHHRLSDVQKKVILTLSENNDLILADLGRKFNVHLPSISRSVTSLVKINLITKRLVDMGILTKKHHRYNLLLELTDSGKMVAAELKNNPNKEVIAYA